MLLIMRNRLFLILFLIAVGCSSHQSAPSSTKEAPKSPEATAKDSGTKGSAAGSARVVLTAYPRQGFMPLHVSFNAVLEGVDENDAQYYCLREEWDFGDGAVSSEQPNCETFTKDTKVNLHFFAEHVFSEEGSYTIRFALGDPVKIRSNQISVLVLEREIGR